MQPQAQNPAKPPPAAAPIVAAQADEAAVRATLREAFEHTLKSASHHFDQLKKAASTT